MEQLNANFDKAAERFKSAFSALRSLFRRAGEWLRRIREQMERRQHEKKMLDRLGESAVGCRVQVPTTPGYYVHGTVIRDYINKRGERALDCISTGQFKHQFTVYPRELSYVKHVKKNIKKKREELS